MVRRLVVASLALVLSATALVACGAAVSDPDRIAPFRAEVPALPIPTPPAEADARDASGDGGEDADAQDAPAVSRPAAEEAEGRPASGAPSDAEIAAELREAFKLPEGQRPGDRDIVDAATLTPAGLAAAPPTAPEAVRAIVHAGNQVARKPYVYGGGHGKWIDTAYDCSASMSYAFAAAGLIERTMVSGEFAKWGEPGPGKWVTIYANDGHAFMTVGGLRFDTSGLKQTGSRWQTGIRSTAGFVVRHPKGL